MLQGDAQRAALAQAPVGPAQGVAYRVIPARYHLTALAAVGAFQRGGRYNPHGRLEALYLSESPIVALQEVEAVQQTSGQLIGLTFSPKTLLSVEYALERLLDLTDAGVQRLLETNLQELTAPWVLEQSISGAAPTQRLGLAVAEAGIEALRAPSSKNPSAANLVIYPDTLRPRSLRVFDDSGFIDAKLP